MMHVVAPDGEYIGVTELPLRIKSIARGQILGLMYDDETGEVFPVAFRIVPAVEGLKYP